MLGLEYGGEIGYLLAAPRRNRGTACTAVRVVIEHHYRRVFIGRDKSARRIHYRVVFLAHAVKSAVYLTAGGVCADVKAELFVLCVKRYGACEHGKRFSRFDRKVRTYLD